jgi:hypothetical protein
VQTNYSVTVGALLSVIANMPAHAETDLTGKWVGKFTGVQIEIPAQPSPFGYLGGEPGAESRQVQGPRFMENTLQITFETQKQGLAVGTWNAGKFKEQFVCAQLTQTQWNCVDAGGRASVEIRSATEIKVCYLDNREGAQGAGCALLRRATG